MFLWGNKFFFFCEHCSWEDANKKKKGNICSHKNTIFFSFVFFVVQIRKRHVFMPNSVKCIKQVLSNLKNNICFCFTKAKSSKTRLIFQNWQKDFVTKKTDYIVDKKEIISGMEQRSIKKKLLSKVFFF